MGPATHKHKAGQKMATTITVTSHSADVWLGGANAHLYLKRGNLNVKRTNTTMDIHIYKSNQINHLKSNYIQFSGGVSCIHTDPYIPLPTCLLTKAR